MLIRNFGHDDRRDLRDDADKLAMEVWQNFDQYSFDCEHREPEELVEDLNFYEVAGVPELDPDGEKYHEKFNERDF